MSSLTPVFMEENLPPAISMAGSGLSSVAPELDPRRGAFYIYERCSTYYGKRVDGGDSRGVEEPVR